MLYAILEKETGKELYYKGDNEVLENEIAIETLRTEDMENPYWDFNRNCFYDKNIIKE
jgi:hypothetical protein